MTQLRRFFAVKTLICGWALLTSLAVGLLMTLPAKSGRQARDLASGSIQGVVRIDTKIHPRSLPLSLYSRRSQPTSSSAAAVEIPEVENVVVYLEGNLRKKDTPLVIRSTPSGIDGGDGGTWAMAPPSIRQVDETFVPHVLPVLVGTTVEFPNFDPFFHNVFSLSGAKSFDLGRYPQGQRRSIRFDRAGIVKVFCHIHSHMSAVILVFDHPYFCTPDRHGRFSLSPIPSGSYTLVVWHERLKPKRQPISVTAGGALTLDLAL
jgi:plastocyanin